MKKMISGIGFCMLIFFLGCGFLFSYEISVLKERIQDLEIESEWIGKQVAAASSSENQIILQEEGNEEESFIVKVKEDYLAVYRTKDNQLFETTDIPMTALSSEEQAEVLAGKEIYGKEALYSFLENYSS